MFQTKVVAFRFKQLENCSHKSIINHNNCSQKGYRLDSFQKYLKNLTFCSNSEVNEACAKHLTIIISGYQ